MVLGVRHGLLTVFPGLSRQPGRQVPLFPPSCLPDATNLGRISAGVNRGEYICFDAFWIPWHGAVDVEQSQVPFDRR